MAFTPHLDERQSRPSRLLVLKLILNHSEIQRSDSQNAVTIPAYSLSQCGGLFDVTPISSSGQNVIQVS
jgi:hypothetical protein